MTSPVAKKGNGMSFDAFVDKAFWALMIAIAGYGVAQIQAAAGSINELNAKMAVVIERITNQQQNIFDHENRLRKLEDSVK